MTQQIDGPVATFKKLPDGSWGIRTLARVRPGDVVSVERRDGSVSRETISEVVGIYGEATVCRLQPKPREARPAANVAADLSGILALFNRAKHHLRRPAIVLGVPAIGPAASIRINIAGDQAKVPGSLTICDGERDEEGQRAWLGRVLLDGTYQPSRDAGPYQRQIVERLREFAARPAEVAAEHGRLTGRCCFCNRALEDERSTAVGYGPICARHFGLPWGSERHSFGEDDEAMMKMMEVEADRAETIRDERRKHARRAAMEAAFNHGFPRGRR